MLTRLKRRARMLWGYPGNDFALAEPPAPEGELAEIFYSGRCRRIHKWTHYLGVYEAHLSRFRGTGFRMLEIGVFAGGSLDMWREYFGPAATLFGIDIDPACQGLADPPTRIRIGSQDDPAFLRSVVDEMGGLDVVLDDGSHVARHQRKSFDTLFPLLGDGGLYMIEDVHTAYWGRFGGGYRRRGTAIELAKELIDDMHGWYHGKAGETQAKDWIPALHIYDSLIVIEKRRRDRPGHIVIGG